MQCATSKGVVELRARRCAGTPIILKVAFAATMPAESGLKVFLSQSCPSQATYGYASRTWLPGHEQTGGFQVQKALPATHAVTTGGNICNALKGWMLCETDIVLEPMTGSLGNHLIHGPSYQLDSASDCGTLTCCTLASAPGSAYTCNNAPPLDNCSASLCVLLHRQS
jgi:hypothetical protein